MPCLKKNASQKLCFLHDLNKHNVYRGIKVIDADGDVGTNATIISVYYSFQFYIFNDL